MKKCENKSKPFESLISLACGSHRKGFDKKYCHSSANGQNTHVSCVYSYAMDMCDMGTDQNRPETTFKRAGIVIESQWVVLTSI